MSFQKELELLINKYDKESLSNTADYILSMYVIKVLGAYEDAVNLRAKHNTVCIEPYECNGGKKHEG